MITPKQLIKRLMALSPVELSEIQPQLTFDPVTGQPIIGAAIAFKPKDNEKSETPKQPTEVKLLKDFFVDLERREVLYADTEWEHISHSIESVLNIREDLIAMMKTIGIESPLYKHLKALAEVCEKFRKMTYKLERTEDGFYEFGTENYKKFDQALNYLRKSFSKWLAIISIDYNIPLEEHVAQVVSLSPNHLPELLIPRNF